jgi:DNA-binding NarL/FixJ family response regulator
MVVCPSALTVELSSMSENVPRRSGPGAPPQARELESLVREVQQSIEQLSAAVQTVATRVQVMNERLAAAGEPSGSLKLLEQDSSAITAREEQVLRLLAVGYSNKEIGTKLDISVKTVETHRARIMRKLHVHTAIDLVRYAIRHRLVKV